MVLKSISGAYIVMGKLKYIAMIFVVAVVGFIGLASWSNVTQKYRDKILLVYNDEINSENKAYIDESVEEKYSLSVEQILKGVLTKYTHEQSKLISKSVKINIETTTEGFVCYVHYLFKRKDKNSADAIFSDFKSYIILVKKQ